MATKKRTPFTFDDLLGLVEVFVNSNGSEILAREAQIGAELTAPVKDGLTAAKSRSAQFTLLRSAVDLGDRLFEATAKTVSKEILMSIARRAPAVCLDGSDLLLATMIVKYASSLPGATYAARSKDSHGLAVLFGGNEHFAAFRLMAIANSMDRLQNMARWLGKGGRLIVEPNGDLKVDLPPVVKQAVPTYEARRPKSSMFDSKGFFDPQPDPKDWTDFRVPIFFGSDRGHYFEAPEGSDQWLYFDRFPSMLDGGGLARLLRGYDEALKETWGVGADPILHFVTALAVLIDHSSPTLKVFDDEGAFDSGASPADFEKKIRFIFGLARKGFLRFPRDELVKQIGRVRTPLAADADVAERLAEDFIHAFLMKPGQASLIEPSIGAYTPFLHPSTDDHIYIDVLLLWDFLASVLEGGKNWYASQHGDHFVLDLKRWLDVASPGSVLQAMRPVRLSDGSISDIDLLIQGPTSLLVVECKAYGKSPDFMMGAPDAVTNRRGRIRGAVRQAIRISEAFSEEIAACKDEFPPGTNVQWLVCTPSVEFLMPVAEHGMVAENVPRVVTPEELLGLVAHEG